MAIACPNCNTPNENGRTKCKNCGESLSSSSTTPESQKIDLDFDFDSDSSNDSGDSGD